MNPSHSLCQCLNATRHAETTRFATAHCEAVLIARAASMATKVPMSRLDQQLITTALYHPVKVTVACRLLAKYVLITKLIQHRIKSEYIQAAIGGAIGGFFFVVIFIALAAMLFRRKRRDSGGQFRMKDNPSHAVIV